jgi:hypothetical protein
LDAAGQGTGEILSLSNFNIIYNRLNIVQIVQPGLEGKIKIEHSTDRKNDHVGSGKKRSLFLLEFSFRSTHALTLVAAPMTTWWKILKHTSCVRE